MQTSSSNQSLDAAACSAVLRERGRLAGEIHDTIVQGFAGILLHLEAAGRTNSRGGRAVGERLARVRDLAKCGLEDARRMLLDLRPRPLEGASLSEALAELAAYFARDCNIACRFSLIGKGGDLPDQIQDELYRVAQEALCNVRKHSRATSVWLSLGCEPGMVVLTIKDNGRGFERKHRARRLGYGLGTMQQRALGLGGRIEINSAPGAGTEIRIAAPLPGHAQAGNFSEWSGNWRR